MRFLVDEMLQALARWLRAAGHDAAVVEHGAADTDVLARARAEDRLLVTCDADFVELGAGPCLVLLGANRLDDAVRELNVRLDVDWRAAPFTRCLVCNTPLTVGGKAGTWTCGPCGKTYWEGGHVRRMRARLDGFARMR